jgi:uncharacterized membrane protein
MSLGFVLLLAFGIGVVTGLRSMTAPAVVTWAAHLGWMHLAGSPVAFMGSAWALGIFSLGALGEFVGDLLPSAPSRTSPAPLVFRIVIGLLTGACISIGGGISLAFGSLVGAVGAVVGAFGGYRARVGLVWLLHVPDVAIALPEDLLAIGLGLLVTSRF